MPLDQKLLEILCCPEMKTSLRELKSEEIQSINALIKSKALVNKKGEAVDQAIETGLLREDQQVLYPVRESIPILLIEEAILPPDGGFPL